MSSNIKIKTVPTPVEGAVSVVETIQQGLMTQTLHTIGLATGGTMQPIYERLRAASLDFSQVTSFNLDEYVGLGADDAHSYAYFMRTELFDAVKFKHNYLPDGMAVDLAAECARYEALLQTSGLDLQLLGVGENGHIAFNEPGTPFESVTHVAELTASTQAVNQRFFAPGVAVPTRALTMGIHSILSAKKIILVAFGERKRDAMMHLLQGDVNPEWPITKLWHHHDVEVITDLSF
ncbi:MAG: glucosamine-6-phosphate deaminase [Neisseriaceae bacterium]|nr:glucosamine-6-phosphate deaminase [Neisseriaceae bacterium]MBP6863485.1 glucosamine-6-phosphate deaminase [Neisseriaceae bacterium]